MRDIGEMTCLTRNRVLGQGDKSAIAEWLDVLEYGTPSVQLHNERDVLHLLAGKWLKISDWVEWP